MNNVDPKTVRSFGQEWTRFDQSRLRDSELQDLFHSYFEIFPWDALPREPEGFDFGCGSGRWAKLVAPRVKTLHCIDASPAALDVAKENLSGAGRCVFHLATSADAPLREESMDFGYALGVLHHMPDPQEGVHACARVLRPGAPLLIYVYYAFDNRPIWFRVLWKVTDWARRLVSRLPMVLRVGFSTIVAITVYLPLARGARLIERLGRDPKAIPLSIYRHRSLYTMRTDALDRFGTRLEKRFTRAQVVTLLEAAGLTNIRVSDSPPYWCAVGFKATA